LLYEEKIQSLQWVIFHGSIFLQRSDTVGSASGRHIACKNSCSTYIQWFPLWELVKPGVMPEKQPVKDKYQLSLTSPHSALHHDESAGGRSM